MHRDDGVRGLERYIEGDLPWPWPPTSSLIPIPGHTAGSLLPAVPPSASSSPATTCGGTAARMLVASRRLDWYSWETPAPFPGAASRLRVLAGCCPATVASLPGRIRGGDAPRAGAGAGRAAAPLTARVAAPLPAVATLPERLGRSLAEQAFSRAAGAPLVR